VIMATYGVGGNRRGGNCARQLPGGLLESPGKTM